MMFDSIIRLIAWTQKDSYKSLENVLAMQTADWEKILRERGIENYVIVSTCNRFEIYYRAQEELEGFFEEASSRKMSGIETIGHLFRVTAGLESMSVGENEILHQVKEAFDTAVKSGNAKGPLALIFRRAISSGKMVRRDTEISKGKVSIPALSMDMLKRKHGVRGKRIAVIGTGKMASDLLKYIQKIGPQKITVVGRSGEKARIIAKTFGVDWDSVSNLKDQVAENDIIITATSSKEIIITRSMISNYGPEKVYLDISNPRNIEEPCEGDSFTLIDLPALLPILEKNKMNKEKEILSASNIVRDQVEAISVRLSGLESEEVIRSLYKHAEEIKEHEISRLGKALASGTDFEEAVKAMASALVNKLLAAQTEVLRNVHGNRLTKDIKSAIEKAYEEDKPKTSSKKPRDRRENQSQQDQTLLLSRKP